MTRPAPAGRLIAVVAPSGAGKDTLLAGMQAARPDIVLARRVITRPESAGGEQHEGVDAAEFERRRRAGAFAVWWRAHGLSYGVPAAINDLLAAGHVVVFNGSRSALPAIQATYPDLAIVFVTAPVEVLRERLIRRRRESPDQIEARLSQADRSAPPGAIIAANDGAVAEGVAELLNAIDLICGTRMGASGPGP